MMEPNYFPEKTVEPIALIAMEATAIRAMAQGVTLMPCNLKSNSYLMTDYYS